jgi:hypothetical protein
MITPLTDPIRRVINWDDVQAEDGLSELKLAVAHAWNVPGCQKRAKAEVQALLDDNLQLRAENKLLKGES